MPHSSLIPPLYLTGYGGGIMVLIQPIAEWGKGDGVLEDPTLIKNQENLYQCVKLLFDDLEQSDYKVFEYEYVKTKDEGHGRIETRKCWTIFDLACLLHLRGFTNWEKPPTISRIRSERHMGQDESIEDRYHIASITGANNSADDDFTNHQQANASGNSGPQGMARRGSSTGLPGDRGEVTSPANPIHLVKWGSAHGKIARKELDEQPISL